MNSIENKRKVLEQDMDFINKVDNVVHIYRNLFVENQELKSEIQKLKANLETYLKETKEREEKLLTEKEKLKKDLDHIKGCVEHAFIDFLDRCINSDDQNRLVDYFNACLESRLNFITIQD